MTVLKKPVRRVTNTALDWSFGADRNRRIVVTLHPGNGKDVADILELRPERTRRSEKIVVSDIFRIAMRCRINNEQLTKAREKKQKLATRRESKRLDAAERRIRKPL